MTDRLDAIAADLNELRGGAHDMFRVDDVRWLVDEVRRLTEEAQYFARSTAEALDTEALRRKAVERDLAAARADALHLGQRVLDIAAERDAARAEVARLQAELDAWKDAADDRAGPITAMYERAQKAEAEAARLCGTTPGEVECNLSDRRRP